MRAITIRHPKFNRLGFFFTPGRADAHKRSILVLQGATQQAYQGRCRLLRPPAQPDRTCSLLSLALQNDTLLFLPSACESDPHHSEQHDAKAAANQRNSWPVRQAIGSMQPTTCVACCELLCCFTPGSNAQDIMQHVHTPARTSSTGCYYLSTPARIAAMNCRISQLLRALGQTYCTISRLRYAQALLELLFLDSHAYCYNGLLYFSTPVRNALDILL